MRIDALDILQPTGARQQKLMHLQLDFATYLELGGEKHVERGLNRALAGVLHRHHAKIGVARFDFLEHFLDRGQRQPVRSEEHTSELQSLMRISYAVFCLKKKTQRTNQ